MFQTMVQERIPQLIETLCREAYRLDQQTDMSPAQWEALRYFSRATQRFRTSADFARHHQTTRGTANQTVLALIRKGYIERVPMPDNMRSQLINMTEKGQEILAHDPLLFMQSALGRLGTDSAEQLVVLLQAVRQEMQLVAEEAQEETAEIKQAM